jgi:hypothetical protein
MFDELKAIFAAARKRGAVTTLQLTAPVVDKPVAPQLSGHGEAQPVLASLLPSQRTHGTGVTFSVDAVEPAKNPLLLSTLHENLEMRSGTSVLIMPDQAAPAAAPQGFLTKHHHADSHEFLHPLAEAVHLAFSDHRPLVLSPDAIWLTIAQGFGQHVQENPEAMRGRIVQHHGQKELIVKTRSLDPEVWPQMVSEFSAQIRENSDPVLHETLLCDFSTTTPTIRAACEVALMDAYQRYFNYIMMCVCGIPSVTLEGTPDDWQRIRDRIEVLATFGLEWWTCKLAPILEQLVATAKGAPDLSFWQAIYKPERAYAAEMATGWITDLFPYLGNSDKRRRNFMLGKKRDNWVPADPGSPESPTGVSLESFPCGLCRAPVTITFPDKPAIGVDLLGGFFGVSQSSEDLSLAPIISWAVVERDTRVARPVSHELAAT